LEQLVLEVVRGGNPVDLLLRSIPADPSADHRVVVLFVCLCACVHSGHHPLSCCIELMVTPAARLTEKRVIDPSLPLGAQMLVV